MKNIASFNIDNTKLLRGIYVSRKDVIEGGGMITVFDIRMKLPNREPALSLSALHTIEHLANHFLRNHPVWGSKIVYWGPKGCCTGNNLIIEGMSCLPILLPSTRIFLELTPWIVATTCSTTCLWQNGKLANSWLRFSTTSSRSRIRSRK